MSADFKNKVALVTGSAGFIGYHISKRLLVAGWRVIGVDCMSDYYEVSLKKNRENMLFQNLHYRSIHAKVEEPGMLAKLFAEERPDVVVHLAAQAGVRYSLENPRAYLNSNIEGSFNILEVAKNCKCKHLMMASTSSVYGSNTQMPFSEIDKTDTPLTFYAATKKANEAMAHSY